MRSHHETIRACLANSVDGMNIAELVQCTKIRSDTLRNSIKTFYGVYIDRWDGPYRGQWRAIYALVDVPEDAPMPDRKAKA